MLTKAAKRRHACRNDIFHLQFKVFGFDRQININFEVIINQLEKTKRNVPAQRH